MMYGGKKAILTKKFNKISALVAYWPFAYKKKSTLKSVKQIRF